MIAWVKFAFMYAHLPCKRTYLVKYFIYFHARMCEKKVKYLKSSYSRTNVLYKYFKKYIYNYFYSAITPKYTKQNNVISYLIISNLFTYHS